MEESYPHSEMLLVYDCMGKSRATTSCKSAWDTTVLWLRWPVRDLVLVTPPAPPKPSLPPPPLIIVASNTRPCSKLGGTTLNGREEGSQNKKIISQTGDQQRFEARKVAFWSESLKIFATGCSSSERFLDCKGQSEAVSELFYSWCPLQWRW